MKIAIVGSTGNVAGRALEKVVSGGAEVKALVRLPEKLPESMRSKVCIEQGTLEDADFVTRATRNADALLWLTPTTFTAQDFRAYTLGLADNAARAVRVNGIQRLVFVSSHGSDRDGLGHVSYAGEVERLLKAVAPNVVTLRSAGFMENLSTSVDALKNGQFFGVLPADKKYPLVATRDLGDVAAKWLLDGSWTGHHVHGVHGPKDLSANDQIEIFSRVIGIPVRYQQIPCEALRDNFLKRGASASVAQGYFEMFRGFSQQDYQPREKRTADTTTLTPLETFVREVLAPRIVGSKLSQA